MPSSEMKENRPEQSFNAGFSEETCTEVRLYLHENGQGIHE